MIWQHWLLLPDSGHLTLHPTAVTCHPCLMAVTCHPRGRRPPGTMALCVVSGIRRLVRACDVPVRGTLRVSASYGPWLLGAHLFVTTGPQWGALACRGSRAALCLGRPRSPVARTHLATRPLPPRAGEAPGERRRATENSEQGQVLSSLLFLLHSGFSWRVLGACHHQEDVTIAES